MDYRMEHKGSQQFLAMVRAFSNEIINVDTDPAGVKKLLNNGYSLWKTTADDYAVFQCLGTDGDCIGEMWSKFYKEFSPQTGYVLTDDTDYEIYFEKGKEGLFCELWIPVKKDLS